MFSGERNPLYRDAAAVGHSPDRSPAVDVAEPRVSERARAARLDPHAAQRVAAVVTARYHHARQGHGRTRCLGRREDNCHHMVKKTFNFFDYSRTYFQNC